MNDPRIGQVVLDNYVVTKKLAEGGMGAVYLAVHPSGLRRVVKYMLAECLQNPAVRARWERECAAAVRLEGREGIVRVDTFNSSKAEPYIVMEYVDGVTLDAHMRQNGRLTPHHTFRIALQILGALAALHEEGIIHRDLKPSNVFVLDTRDGGAFRTKLIDFGIVHDQRAVVTAEFKTREGQMIGTPGYMATEQYGHADKVTPATDVFACAVIIWEMLTGQLPWGIAPNEFAQHDRQARETPVWPADVTLPFADQWPALLLSALSPSIEKRPATAQIFALQLALALQPQPPFVPSGVDMVEKLVPRFLQNVPAELETVRHPNAGAALLWPPRPAATPVGGVASVPVASWAVPVSAVTPGSMPVASVATVNARPKPSEGAQHASVAPPATTISGSTGVSVPITQPSPGWGRSRLVAFGLGTALAVGGVTFAVTRLQGRGTSSAEQPVSPASPTVAAPADPMDAPAETRKEEHVSTAGTAPIDAGLVDATTLAAPRPKASEHAVTRPEPSSSRAAKKHSKPPAVKVDPSKSSSTQPHLHRGDTKPHDTSSGSAAPQPKPFDIDAVKE